MKQSTRLFSTVLLVALLVCGGVLAQRRQPQPAKASKPMHEVNAVARPDANRVIAIVGATLIDGRGGAPLLDAVVVVRGERIVAVGKRASVSIPPWVEVVEAKGLALVTGLIGSYFYIE